MIGNMRDMENVADHQTFELLPEGEYLVEIIEREDSHTKEHRDPMINLVLEVSKGDFKGKRLYDRIILSENELSPGWKMRWRAKMFLKAIGEEHHGNAFQWDSDRWLWRKCHALIIQKKRTVGKYAGELGNEIKAYSPLNEDQVREAVAALPPGNTAIDPDIGF